MTAKNHIYIAEYTHSVSLTLMYSAMFFPVSYSAVSYWSVNSNEEQAIPPHVGYAF